MITMRKTLLAALVTLLPSLACAQTAPVYGPLPIGVFPSGANATPEFLQTAATKAASATLTYGGALTLTNLVQFTNSFDGGGLPGVVAPNGLRFRKPAPTSTDSANFLFIRDAAFTGGSPGVNNNVGINCNSAAGITSYEWCASVIMTNSGTSADGSQNVAFATKMQKLSTGASWGRVDQFQDYTTGDPTTSSVGVEHDMAANGTDTSLQRVAYDLIFQKRDGAGSNPTFSFGLRFAADAVTTVTKAIAFSHGTYETLIGTTTGGTSQPAFNHGVDLSAATCVVDCFKSNGFQVTGSGVINATTGVFSTVASDTATTDATACLRASDGLLLKGTGTLGICLGTSSLRFKHDVRPLTAGLDDVMKLQPIVYRYNKGYGDTNKDLYGFGAEQVQTVLPDLVGLDKEGKPSSADYLGVVPVLVKAMQEQQKQITDLQRELNALNQRR